MELRIWWDEDSDEPTIVRKPAELDAVLDKICALDYPVLVEMLDASDPYRVVLDAGFHGDRGVLYYTGPGHEEGCFSESGTDSDTSSSERVLYYYMSSDREFPRTAEVHSVDVIRRACHEYMGSNGARPTVVGWQSRSVLG